MDAWELSIRPGLWRQLLLVLLEGRIQEELSHWGTPGDREAVGGVHGLPREKACERKPRREGPGLEPFDAALLLQKRNVRFFCEKMCKI